MWPVIFSALSAILAGLSLLVAFYAVRNAARRVASPLQAIRSLESRAQLLENSLKDALQLILDLENRLKMTRVRAAAKHSAGSSGEPDPYRDPDAWRKMMNTRISMNRIGGNGK